MANGQKLKLFSQHRRKKSSNLAGRSQIVLISKDMLGWVFGTNPISIGAAVAISGKTPMRPLNKSKRIIGGDTI